MHQALFMLFAATAPATEPGTAGMGPWTPGGTVAQPAAPEAAPPAAPPAGAPAAAPAATPPETPAPAPAAPAPAAKVDAPAHGYKRPPAVGETESTAFNAKWGDESEAGQSRYKIGKGWTVSSKDGRFSLQLRGRIQFRYDLEHPNVEGKDSQHLLQIRRARVVLMGTVFSPFIKYHFQFGFSPLDMRNYLPTEEGSIRRNPLRDARIEIDRLRDFTIWMGQMKVPFSRQRVVSSAYMNMVDRSMVNAEFNLDRDIGIMALSKDLGGLGGRLAYYAGVFMGEGRNAFNFNDFGMLYVGRLEVRPFGAFDDYTEGDLARSAKPGLSIAGAYAYQDRAHAARGVLGDYPADRGTTNFHHVNADLLFKWRGLSLTTAFHYRRGLGRINGGALDDMGMPIPTVPARSGIGWYAQAGYVVPKIPLEVVGRYGLIRNTFGAESSMIGQDEVGGGLNWYIVGHDLKVQLDYHRLWDASMGASFGDAARQGLDRLRLQVQLYF